MEIRSSIWILPIDHWSYEKREFFSLLQFITFAGMQKVIQQNPEILKEVARLKLFFETTPILIKEWREGCMYIKDIPHFINLELNAAATFNPQHPFNPPLKRLLQLEQAVRNQITAVPNQ